MPREAPYHLVLELCRGTLSRIMSQFSEAMLEQPTIRPVLSEATHHFVQAALQQDNVERSAGEAEAALDICLQLIRKCLGLALRQSASHPVPFSRLTGFQVDQPADLERLMRVRRLPGNAVFYKRSWRDTEPNPGEFQWDLWQRDLKRIRQARRRIVCGPLFRLARNELPDWLYLWDEDFDALHSYLTSYIQTAVAALKADVQLWYVAAGTNIETELHLTEEQRLKLTLAAVETLRQTDPQTPALVGIRQPWGEYLGHAALDLSPWQFADIVVRSGLGTSGFVLEMNIACAADRTLPRDALEWNRLIDQWSSFGLPLVVSMALPNPSSQGPMSTETHQNVAEIIAILQQKPAIQGIIWGRTSDQPDWPAGVLADEGQMKPMLTALAKSWRTPASEP
jgi:hypothetical protein